MAGLPTVQVLLDNGTGTFPYDITAWAQLVPGYKAKRGRQDELADVTPGELSLVLDNTDGRFTLGSTIIATPSPIQVDQKIRIKITANATVFTRATAYVQSWPVEWPAGGDEFAIASIASTDVQAQGQRQPLLSIIEQEILPDNPIAYYTMGEAAGATSAGDSSGNQAVTLPAGALVTFGNATGPGTDGLTAAQIAGPSIGFWAGDGTTTPQISMPILSALYVFSTTTLDAMQGLGLTNNQAVPPRHFGSFEHSGISGKLSFLYNGGLITTANAVNDGATHVAEAFYSGGSCFFYLDGVLVGSAVVAAPNTTDRIVVGSLPTVGDTLVVAHVALFATATGATRAAVHASAILTGFAGESSTARITRLAGYANLPLGTLDTSLTNVAFTDITGKPVIEAIRDVADAEMGLVFFDGSGNLTFHNRNRAVSKLTPDATIDANFLAEGTQFVVDMQGVLNYFQVTAEGTKVTQLVRDTVSENGDGTAAHPKHGRYPGSKSYLVQTDREALDRGNWIVSTHSQPAPRVGSLVVDVLTMTAAQQAAMAALEPNSWLRVTGLPGQTPGSTTADFIVEGWAEAVNAGEWTLTINAANKAVAAPTPWILGDTTWSVLGSTTKLYV